MKGVIGGLWNLRGHISTWSTEVWKVLLHGGGVSQKVKGFLILGLDLFDFLMRMILMGGHNLLDILKILN